jgi:xylan 1,4-beta-xylosidase
MARQTITIAGPIVFALLGAVAGIHAHAQTPPTAAAFDVDIRVDAAKIQGPLSRAWSYFGADEPNYATMKDGENLLGSLGALNPGHVYFRTHHLLTSGDGTAALKWGSTNIYAEDASGNPVYNYTIIDHIFDTYLKHGVKPYVEIGFMPQALSSKPEPYRSDWRPGLEYGRIGSGLSYPPKDYDKWGALVFRWVTHCLERYGRTEVESWYFEVWNEANLPAYWKGTAEEFYRLHDVAIAAVRRALPMARVGGPDMAGSGAFLDGFLAHIASGANYAGSQVGTTSDFLSFHAKGQPSFIGDHVRMNMSPQLSDVDHGFKTIAADPKLANKAVVIGESDPDGCAACLGPQLGYRNGTMYSSYTAASFPRIVDLARRDHVRLDGVVTWAFEFEDQPYFAGYRQLMSNGVDLPVLNVFRMFARMNGDQIEATSSGEIALDEVVRNGVHNHPDVGVLGARRDDEVTVMVWHYFDDDVPGPAAQVAISVADLPRAYEGGAQLTHYRIDDEHSNAYAAWRRMGAPQTLKDADFDALKSLSGLQTLSAPETIAVVSGRAKLVFSLPRQGISLLLLRPQTTANGEIYFQRNCASCHSVASSVPPGAGPGLFGVVGRTAGAMPNFNYSAALARANASGTVWSAAHLDTFLSDPQRMLPGTQMPIGVTTRSDRASLIAYLGSLKSADAPAAATMTAARTAVTSQPADWRLDRPGRLHHIGVENLPAPFAVPSAGNPPHIARQPDGVMPAVPAGFQVSRYATDPDRGRLLLVAPNGDVFLSEPGKGQIKVLRSSNGETADTLDVFIDGLDRPYGMAFYPSGADPQYLYVANINSVVRIPYANGDLKARGAATTIVDHLTTLPGAHTTRSVTFSKDDRHLYVSVGSATNVANTMPERPPQDIGTWEAKHGLGAAWGDEAGRAMVAVFDPDGSNRKTFATGLRNCVGLVTYPPTGDLMCSTNERDALGDDLPPDYVTRVSAGAYFGWPWYYIGSHEDPRLHNARPDLKDQVTTPDVLLQPHSAPLGMAVYQTSPAATHAFPADYQGDVFVALHGSWNRASRTGTKVVRVAMKDGAPSGSYEDFMTGMILSDDAVWGRPCSVAVAADGALLVDDDATGTIWRIVPTP